MQGEPLYFSLPSSRKLAREGMRLKVRTSRDALKNSIFLKVVAWGPHAMYNKAPDGMGCRAHTTQEMLSSHVRASLNRQNVHKKESPLANSSHHG